MDKAHNLWPLGKNSLTKTFRDTRKPTPSPPSAKSPERWNVHSSLLASFTVILDSANFWWVSDRQTTPSLLLSEWNRSCWTFVSSREVLSFKVRPLPFQPPTSDSDSVSAASPWQPLTYEWGRDLRRPRFPQFRTRVLFSELLASKIHTRKGFYPVNCGK